METVGWKEWVHLPALDIGPIKAKIDTGARTSSLHAYDICIHDAVVDFKVHTIQDRDDFSIACQAPLLEERLVRDSGGHESMRPVIQTTLRMCGKEIPIELTLIDRKEMQFRMLVGRTAVAGGFLVDCDKEYLGGVPDVVRNWQS